MSQFSNKVLELCNSRYQEIFANYNANAGKKIMVSHFGEFSQELVNSMTNKVEESMFDAGDKKGTVKRVFSILVEGLQNIRLHGEKDEDGYQASFIVIAYDDDEYHITSGNLVLNENIDKILERLEQINSLDERSLKEYYMEVLTNGIISNKGGAGLGFITMAMKSKNKLTYNFEQVSEQLSCFTVDTLVKRRK